MKRFTVLFCCLLIAGTCVFAQKNDSLVFAKAKWKTEKIAKGIKLKQAHFTDSSLFNSNQFISLLFIKGKTIGKKYRIDIKDVKKLTPTSKIAQDNMAIAAVNGSFFTWGKEYLSVDYLRVDNEEVAKNIISNNNVRPHHQLGTLATNNCKLSILKPLPLANGNADYNWEQGVIAEDMLTSGPLLIYNSNNEQMLDASFYTTRHPRTAIATLKDGTTIFIVVDGRNINANGMSLKEMQSIMKFLGATNGLNLDGGGSSTMYINNRGIVNHPTDNKKFDNQGERSVANAVVISVK